MIPDEAVVLAGGIGSRLRAALPDVPKVVAPVAGRPFLDHLFRYLEREGVASVVLATGYAAERVEQTAHAHRGRLQLAFSREDEPLGTGGAIAKAFASIHGERAWVFNGDSFCDARLRDVAAAAEAHPDDAWLVAVRVDDAGRFGTLALDDSRVVSFLEKSGRDESGWINAGIYLLPRVMLEDRPCSIERDLFPQWAAAGRLRAVRVDAPFLDIGTPESYAAAEQFFA